VTLDAPLVRLLSRSQVRSLLRWPGLIEAAAQALIDASSGDSAAASSQLHVPGAALHLKSGVTEDGVTEDGVTEDGVTEDGVTEDGVTEDGVTDYGGLLAGDAYKLCRNASTGIRSTISPCLVP
jgi:hypothetical protein